MAAGHFTLKNGRNFTTAASLATFNNAGVLEVGVGSTFAHHGAGGLAHSGVIAGDGTVNATVLAQHGSILSPGSSPGTLTLAGLFTTGDMFLDWELGATADADKVVANNLLDFNNRQHTIRLIDAGGTPNPANSYPLFELVNGSIQNAQRHLWTLEYSQAPRWTGGVLSVVGNQVVLSGLQAIVPEPATALLCLVAIGFIAAKRRTTRR